MNTYKIIDNKFFDIVDDVTVTATYSERNKTFTGDVRITLFDGGDYTTKVYSGEFNYADFAKEMGFILWHDAMVEDLSPRFCEITHQQMWEGYVLFDDVHIKDEASLLDNLRAYLEHTGDDVSHWSDKKVLNYCCDEEMYYYTEWEELDGMGFTKEGFFVEV